MLLVLVIISVALETEHMNSKTVSWLKWQNGKRETRVTPKRRVAKREAENGRNGRDDNSLQLCIIIISSSSSNSSSNSSSSSSVIIILIIIISSNSSSSTSSNSINVSQPSQGACCNPCKAPPTVIRRWSSRTVIRPDSPMRRRGLVWR